MLSEGQQYVLTARFQSDPIERRFGQYRQKSGGRFLISAKDIAISEKILKVKTFVKEGFQFDTGILLTEGDRVEVAKLLDEVEVLIGQLENLTLNSYNRCQILLPDLLHTKQDICLMDVAKKNS